MPTGARSRHGRCAEAAEVDNPMSLQFTTSLQSIHPQNGTARTHALGLCLPCAGARWPQVRCLEPGNGPSGANRLRGASDLKAAEPRGMQGGSIISKMSGSSAVVLGPPTTTTPPSTIHHPSTWEPPALGFARRGMGLSTGTGGTDIIADADQQTRNFPVPWTLGR